MNWVGETKIEGTPLQPKTPARFDPMRYCFKAYYVNITWAFFFEITKIQIFAT